MPAYYDETHKTWYTKFYYTDYIGTRKQKLKRGFALKRDALDFEKNFLEKLAASPSMKFSSLADLYLEDRRTHCKMSTYTSKAAIIRSWILPYFSSRPVNEISAADIRKWHGALKGEKGKTGGTLAPGYLKIIATELSCVFNYAVRFHGLPSNPCRIVGSIGKAERSVNFWTKTEFDSFIATFSADDPYYAAFMVLYYTGLRIGELQALTISDIDLGKGVIHVTKTYARIDGREVITEPKTKKSRRDVMIPSFLCGMLEGYISRIYGADGSSRIFIHHKGTYGKVLKAHAAQAGVKAIRIHDIRHSHASLLIDLGFSALLVSERLGHENVSTTLNTYSHLFPSRQSEVVEKLEKLQENKK